MDAIVTLNHDPFSNVTLLDKIKSMKDHLLSDYPQKCFSVVCPLHGVFGKLDEFSS